MMHDKEFGLTSGSDELFDFILKNSYKEADSPIFKLSAGGYSNYYFDLKQTSMHPLGLKLLAKTVYCYIARSLGESFKTITAIGGPTMGADPICAAIALYAIEHGKILKFFSVRKEPKGHGTNKMIVGPVSPGERVVLIEDVTTTGSTILKAANAVKEFGMEIALIFSILDREEGGLGNIIKTGFKIFRLFSKDQFKKT